MLFFPKMLHENLPVTTIFVTSQGKGIMLYPCKFLIFDFDGTLCDTSTTILASYNDTLSELHLPAVTESVARATIGLPLRECYRHLVNNSTEELLDRCYDIHHRYFEKNSKRFRPTLFPGVKSTLEQLHQRGIVLSVASSRGHDSLCHILDDCSILSLFSLVLGAEDVERAKPDPFPVLLALRRLGFRAEDTIVVGDMPVDIAMGQGADCRTIAVDYGNASLEELQMSNPNAIISCFNELSEELL